MLCTPSCSKLPSSFLHASDGVGTNGFVQSFESHVFGGSYSHFPFTQPSVFAIKLFDTMSLHALEGVANSFSHAPVPLESLYEEYVKNFLSASPEQNAGRFLH